jgi:hypothetical protein
LLEAICFFFFYMRREKLTNLSQLKQQEVGGGKWLITGYEQQGVWGAF